MIWTGILLLTLLALKGLVIVGQFIGYATVTARGGTITELIVEHAIPTDFWAAVSGIAIRVEGYTEQQYETLNFGMIREINLLFDCMQRDIQHEVYAVWTDPRALDLSALYPMTPLELDTLLGKDPADFDSASRTYTETVSFSYGTATITAPGTTTFAVGQEPPVTFRIALAKTRHNDPVFVALKSNFTKGFNNRTFNYQLLLPAPNATTFYFFSDPYDICGSEEGDSPLTGQVYGTVTTTTGTPIPDVIVIVGGAANLSRVDGNYNMTAPVGYQFIFALKTGYRVYQNNVTIVAGNDTRHNIILEEEYPPNPATGSGPGQDSPGDTFTPPVPPATGGAGEGPGEVPPMPIIQQPTVISGTDYIISLSELNRKLRLGQFLQERIFLYSFKKAPARVTFRVNGTEIGQLISVDRTELTIEPNGKDQFVLTIFGVGETGIFEGTIELEGDLNASIPVTIEVLPREQLPVEALHMEVETAKKSYLPDDLVRVKTDLRNLLTDRQYPVRLFYTVQDVEGKETLWTYETNAYLETAFSLIKSFELPSEVRSGDYVLRVTANYLSLSSGTSTIFHVDVPFWQRTLLGLKYWLWLLLLLLIGGAVVAGFLIKRNIESKKKYHLKVDYDELPKPGPRNILVGRIAETDKPSYFNLENFKTHTIVAGSTGGGKSVSAQVIIEEALEKGVAILAFDPTAQWTGMLRPCKDKTMLALYPLYGMKKTDAKAYNGNIRMILDPREKIDIKRYVKPGEIQVFCGHKLDPKDMDIMVANAIRQIFHANFPENKLLKVMFVFDEVHRLLPKFGGSGDGFLQIERGCREFRKWGLGIMLISQVLSDFVGTIKANINTEIQMRTRDEGDLERIRQKYGEDVLRSLVKATVGTGMVENPAYNRGQPFFVAFRPLKHSVERLTDEEIEQYNTYNDQLDDLFFSLEQLEKEGIDVFDLKLELKLAQDKVKTGNFNMVKIYLEGLTPRIDSQWMKLGKKPKRLERELVDMGDIQAELAKAQQERDKYVAAQQAGQPVGGGAEAAPKERGWKDDVPPDKILNLKNGMIVINLASLFDEVSAMKDADLPNEFDPEPKPPAEGQPAPSPKNRFAIWVRDAVGDAKLANALAAAKTKEEILAVLQKKKEGKDVGDVKPPAWFAAPLASAPVVSAPVVSAPVVSAPVAPSSTPDAAPAVRPGPAAPPPSISPEPSPVQTPSPPSDEPVAAAKSIASLDSLVVNDGQAFRLENGMLLRSVRELVDYLPRMEEWLFRNHVSEGYNHFADWIKGVFHDEELARRVANAHTKEEVVAAITG